MRSLHPSSGNAGRAGERLRALRAQLAAVPRVTASTYGSTTRLEALNLPSLPVELVFFDAERFFAEHGPDAHPVGGYLKHADPEIEARNKARVGAKYSVKYTVPLIDARPALGFGEPAKVANQSQGPRLDDQGFELIEAPTKLSADDFRASLYPPTGPDDPVQRTYLSECEEMLKRTTGATRVLVYDYVIRNERKVKTGEAAGYTRGAPHNDHTLNSGPRRARDTLGPEPVNDEVLKNYRYMLLNVWRRWDDGNGWPLACCDLETLDYSHDMIPQHLLFQARVGETYGVRRSPNHRFYWFSDMQKDEAILLKTYDSKETVARGSVHTAFKNPLYPENENAVPRESLEVRCLLLFAPEELTSRVTSAVQMVFTPRQPKPTKKA